MGSAQLDGVRGIAALVIGGALRCWYLEFFD
jgi:hypothetical protein